MATPVSERMEALKINDAALAAKVGCERSMVTKIKLGKAKPSLRLAVELGKVLDLPADAFLPPSEIDEAVRASVEGHEAAA